MYWLKQCIYTVDIYLFCTRSAAIDQWQVYRHLDVCKIQIWSHNPEDSKPADPSQGPGIWILTSMSYLHSELADGNHHMITNTYLRGNTELIKWRNIGYKIMCIVVQPHLKILRDKTEREIGQ